MFGGTRAPNTKNDAAPDVFRNTLDCEGVSYRLADANVVLRCGRGKESLGVQILNDLYSWIKITGVGELTVVQPIGAVGSQKGFHQKH